jgi:hypothetical protein
MRAPSNNYLYDKINNKIKTVKAFTEIDYLDNIITACRLKPYKYLLSKRDDRVPVWWVDEYYNSLMISKKTHIIYNDLKIDRTKITSTDLYYGLSLSQILKISFAVHLVLSKEDCYLLTFLGIDNYFRSYLIEDGQVEKVSPLLLGIKPLQRIFKNLEGLKYINLTKKKNILACASEEVWLSCMPCPDKFLRKIKNHEIIYDLLKG